MSMENTENLDVKPEENKEQVALDFGNMAPDEIQELKEEPDTTGVRINLEDVGNEVSAVDGEYGADQIQVLVCTLAALQSVASTILYMR